MEEEIYLDYAAAAPVSIEALEAAQPFFASEFFNPSSAHAAGQRAAAAVEKARALCASAIGASPREILFTGGGTDAVTKGITGIVSDRKRVVISDIEHECVESAAKELESRGFSVDEVHVGSDGIVSPEELKKKVDGDTALVCVLTVNNITGALQPIKQLCEAAHECGALFFTDAVQAVNAVDIDVRDWSVDMLAVAAHKFYGMKGAGFLYIKSGVPHLSPKKTGTKNVPAIVAMGRAMDLATANRKNNVKAMKAVEDAFLSALKFGAPIMPKEKVPGIVSVAFEGIKAGRLAVALSMSGIYCSVGAACSAGSATAPKTLLAMGLKNADSALRFSFSHLTTEEQARKAAEAVNRAVAKLI